MLTFSVLDLFLKVLFKKYILFKKSWLISQQSARTDLLVISNSSWQHCLVLRDTVVVCSYVNYVFLRKDFRPKYFKFYWPGSYPFLLLNGQMKLKNSKLFWYSLSSNFQNNANTFRTDPDPNRTVMLEQRCSNVIS